MEEKNRKSINLKFESFIRKRFTRFPDDENQEMIINIQNWLLNSHRYRKSLKGLLDYTARTIFRIFEFKEISIGIRDLDDGLYKYVTVLGFTKQAEIAQREKTYTFKEIQDYDKYPGIKLTGMSDLCVADELKETYNRPFELDKERESIARFTEGDYLDISIYDSKVQLIGWMELANPKNGKMPSKDSLLWIELFVSILGIMIEREIILLQQLRE